MTLLLDFLINFYVEAVEWARGKNWFIRLPAVLFFGNIFYHHLVNPEYNSILKALNLGIHELGHFIFMFFGQFMQILGGTFWECAAPMIGMWNFYRQRDFFAIGLCFGWLSTAFFDVARYAADASAMALPLVAPFGGGDEVIHDWNYLLTQMGMLSLDQAVAGFFKGMAVFSMLVCFLISGWLLWHMLTRDKT